MQRIQLALLVPDRITRGGIEGLIRERGYSHYEINIFKDFEPFFQSAGTMHILLLDSSGLRIDKIESRLTRPAECCPALRVIVISSQPKVQFIRRILQLGAKGFILRDSLADDLINSLDVVRMDLISLSPEILRLLTDADQLYVANDLKPLDFAVLRMLARGLTVKGIAAELEISTRTAYRSRDKLREILGVQNNETLIDAAREQGLLDIDDPE